MIKNGTYWNVRVQVDSTRIFSKRFYTTLEMEKFVNTMKEVTPEKTDYWDGIESITVTLEEDDF